MQDGAIAAPPGRSKNVNPNSLANLRSKKVCPGCGYVTGNRKSGKCGQVRTTTDLDGQTTIVLDANRQEVRCQHVFETCVQRRLKKAAEDSIAERPLHLPEGTGHMTLSHVEESFDKIVTKVELSFVLI